MAEPSPNLAANNETIVLGGGANAADASRHSSHNALPIGTRMGEFEIIGLIGEGGFGIVYLALDHSLDRKVALKEYMPASLAARAANAAVRVRSERHQDTFGIGLRSFVNEARLLARFDHPALVKVYRFWEANGTAYMAMPYYDGRTLREVLAENQTAPDEATLRRLLAPVLDALELIHAEQCFHRDIAPDNIMLLRDGRPVLLDFGAARRVISDMTQALTVILKPGYAPIEQYAEMPGMKQGPWTDIYALAAVVYYAILRKLPPPSVSRIVQDHYEPLTGQAAGRYSHTFLRGIDACLSVKAEQRPQTIAAMRMLIGMASATPAAPAEMPTPVAGPAQGQMTPRPMAIDQDELRPPAAPTSGGQRRPLPVLMTAGILTLAAVGVWQIKQAPAPAEEALPVSRMSEAASTPAIELSAVSAVPESGASTPPAPVEALSAPITEVSSPVLESPQVESAIAPAEVSAPPTTQSTVRSVKASRPAAAARSSAKPDNQGDKAERDYMRQLNQDLDKLMR